MKQKQLVHLVLGVTCFVCITAAALFISKIAINARADLLKAQMELTKEQETKQTRQRSSTSASPKFDPRKTEIAKAETRKATDDDPGEKATSSPRARSPLVTDYSDTTPPEPTPVPETLSHREPSMRSWTLNDKAFEARLTEVSPNAVALENPDGKTARISIKKLSEADQKYAASKFFTLNVAESKPLSLDINSWKREPSALIKGVAMGRLIKDAFEAGHMVPEKMTFRSIDDLRPAAHELAKRMDKWLGTFDERIYTEEVEPLAYNMMWVTGWVRDEARARLRSQTAAEMETHSSR